jgi:hypothetical protein
LWATPDLDWWHPFLGRLPDTGGVRALACSGHQLFAAVSTGIQISDTRHCDWPPLGNEALDLFVADPALAQGLAPGKPTPDLVARFARAGIAVDPATLAALPPGPEASAAWRIADTAGQAYRLLSGKSVTVQTLCAGAGQIFAIAARQPAVNRGWPGFALDGQSIALDRILTPAAPGALFVLCDGDGACAPTRSCAL